VSQQPAHARGRALVIALVVFLAAPTAHAGPRPQDGTSNAGSKVTAVPEEVVQKFKLDTSFYKKHVNYKGFSILSSAKVSDAALLEARHLIDRLLHEREDILKAMIRAGCRFMVMAPTEMTTDVPEQRHMDKAYWDRRARGLGGKLSSCGEENLLNLKGDRYRQENILIHEFNHAVHRFGLGGVDPTFDRRLRETYKKAMAKELWKGTYVATNPGEYWAEGVQAYFDCMRPQFGANSREKLQKYDADLFALVDEVYKQSKFRYVRYDRRAAPAAQAPAPVVYTVKFPEPAAHYALVEADFPTGKQDAVELMMPVWTPGFYRVADYAGQVQSLAARAPDGAELAVEKVTKNRWRIQTGGAATVRVSYKLLCKGRSVTGNWVGDDLLVLNGGSALITPADRAKRPHEVRLELPPTWKRSMTGLDPAPDGKPHHYRAADYDTLVDSPILAGNLAVTEFDVAGSKHFVVAGGETAQWDGERAAADLRKVVRENRRLWGTLPFPKYVFLFVVREKGGGGGGLEHANSALMFSGATAARGKGTANLTWLMFVSHEYFHAFNVKRLRPVELGPFDYEKPPRTTGLWEAEGLTTYYGDLLVRRAGLCDMDGYLARLSGHIGRLQKTPGRLVQTLDQASHDVWTSGMSGIGGGAKTISYYVKGPVVGFLLDAKIRRATGGAKSLDDVMRLAYRRYGGEKGFTADQFRQAAEEVAGADLKEPFRKWLATTEELDYTEALEWFGLRFAPGEGEKKTWRLEALPDATAAQRERLRAWLDPSKKTPK
jgi:predicted metalloprotease with PDZ domain